MRAIDLLYSIDQLFEDATIERVFFPYDEPPTEKLITVVALCLTVEKPHPSLRDRIYVRRLPITARPRPDGTVTIDPITPLDILDFTRHRECGLPNAYPYGAPITSTAILNISTVDRLPVVNATTLGLPPRCPASKPDSPSPQPAPTALPPTYLVEILPALLSWLCAGLAIHFDAPIPCFAVPTYRVLHARDIL